MTFNLEEFLEDPDALQRPAAGGAPCRLRCASPASPPRSRTAGREGYYHVGVPPSGALDQFSLLAANLLVGNDAGAAGLECAYQGPELVFGEDAVVAVCGADLEPRVDGEARETVDVVRRAGRRRR